MDTTILEVVVRKRLDSVAIKLLEESMKLATVTLQRFVEKVAWSIFLFIVKKES